jgi:WD40 repeat protein
VKVWEADKSQEALSLTGHQAWVNSVAYSPDGKHIISGSGDHTVMVWDADKRQELLSLKGHTGEVCSVSYSPDGKRIVSGSADKMLKVWDAQTGQELLSLKGHTAQVSSVVWSPDGKHIVSGSGDCTLKVWEADTGKEVRSLKGHRHWVCRVGYSSDGKRISGENSVGKVLTWDASTGVLLRDAKPVPMRSQTEAVRPDGSQCVFIDDWELKVVFSRDLGEVQKREQACNRAFLERLARPGPAYHRQRADQYDKSGDLFAAAFHLRRLLLIEPREVLRKRLALIESKLAAQTQIDAKMPQKPAAKMPYAK